MDRAFKLGLFLAALAIIFVLFQYSKNGRYQLSSTTDSNSKWAIVDTRTGEFWTEEGSHFEPRAARITAHAPQIVDLTDSDNRRNAYLECLHNKGANCLEMLTGASK